MKDVAMRFFDLLERSIILQSVITTAFVGGALYLWIAGKPVPDALTQGLWAVLGYWFGTKAQHAIDANRAKRGG